MHHEGNPSVVRRAAACVRARPLLNVPDSPRALHQALVHRTCSTGARPQLQTLLSSRPPDRSGSRNSTPGPHPSFSATPPRRPRPPHCPHKTHLGCARPPGGLLVFLSLRWTYLARRYSRQLRAGRCRADLSRVSSAAVVCVGSESSARVRAGMQLYTMYSRGAHRHAPTRDRMNLRHRQLRLWVRQQDQQRADGP